jgi:hypothetical protein
VIFDGSPTVSLEVASLSQPSGHLFLVISGSVPFGRVRLASGREMTLRNSVKNYSGAYLDSIRPHDYSVCFFAAQGGLARRPRKTRATRRAARNDVAQR